MDEVFNNITTSKIDAKLYRDILEHKDKVEKICIIVFCLLLFIFRGWIGFWLKYGVAFPSGYVRTSINVTDEPIQTNYLAEQRKEKTFTYNSFINDYNVKLTPQAHYEVSGRVLGTNYRLLMVRGFFYSSAPFNIGIGWDKLADRKFYNEYYDTYIGNSIYPRDKTYSSPLTREYLTTHFTHSYVLPASRNVFAALLKLTPKDNVKLEGELVDMAYKDITGYTYNYKTRLSRTNTSDPELFYVTSVQIGHYIYK